jgi:hypothetical protein
LLVVAAVVLVVKEVAAVAQAVIEKVELQMILTQPLL